MKRPWRWRPRGLFTLGVTLGLVLGRQSTSVPEASRAPRSLDPKPTTRDCLDEVESPVFPARKSAPLRPTAERAVRDVAAVLDALLRPTEGELGRADPEWVAYYQTELAPRLLEPWKTLHDEDVFDLSTSDEGPIVIVGTWRDTFFCHDLWFVAGLERHFVSGRYVVTLFRKLRAPVQALRAVDLDGDDRAEIVIRTLFGVPGNGPAWHVHVLSRGRNGWTGGDLSSEERISVLSEGASTLFVEDGGDAPRAWRWGPEGFTAPGAPAAE